MIKMRKITSTLLTASCFLRSPSPSRNRVSAWSKSKADTTALGPTWGQRSLRWDDSDAYSGYHMAMGQKDRVPKKTALVKGRLDQNLRSLVVFFLTQSQMDGFMSFCTVWWPIGIVWWFYLVVLSASESVDWMPREIPLLQWASQYFGLLSTAFSQRPLKSSYWFLLISIDFYWFIHFYGCLWIFMDFYWFLFYLCLISSPNSAPGLVIPLLQLLFPGDPIDSPSEFGFSVPMETGNGLRFQLNRCLKSWEVSCKFASGQLGKQVPRSIF